VDRRPGGASVAGRPGSNTAVGAGSDLLRRDVGEWLDSPEGELWTDMSDTLEVLLKDVGLDAGRRRFLWPDTKRLNLKQSARHIHQLYPNFPEDKIEEFLIHWIQELYVPEGYSESQMDELERLTEKWAEDHSRRSTRRRTRHS
jgi:hypothetical protein